MRPIAAVWQRLPIIPRAVLVGSFVTGMGTMPWSILAGVNLTFAPWVPWSVPVMALYLWLYWQYVGGRGWPRATAELRRRKLRAGALTGGAWRWSLLAGGLGWAGLLALRIFSDTFFKVPQDPLPDEPFFTIVAYIVMASAVAGITEEAGFRGYMQGPIEQRHGPLVAILVVGTMFWLAHSSSYIGDWWLLFGYMPFYLAGAAIFGTLVYLTGSILPGVVLHAAADVLGLGLLWWSGSSLAVHLADDQRDLLLWSACLAGVMFIIAAVWAYRRLAVVVHTAALRR